MDVAELYLSMIRPNGVPVVGECVAEGFIGQIQVERWNWNLMNDDEIKRAGEDEKDYQHHSEFLSKQPSADLRKKLANLTNDKAMEDRRKARKSSEETFNKAIEELETKMPGDSPEKRKKMKALRDDHAKEVDKAMADDFKANEKFRLEFESLSRDLSRDERKYMADLDKQVNDAADEIAKTNKAIEDNEEAYAKKNKSYEFVFSKRVDFATTQLLNSMKAGDVFPLAVLTIHQRSSNAGMSLVFTVTQLRLLDYNLRADVSETMTDMKEQWKAEFRSLAYVYKNRRAIESSDDAAEAAAKVATQGTVRTFAMKKDLGI